MGKDGKSRGRPLVTDVDALLRQGYRPPMAELVARLHGLAAAGGFDYLDVAARFAPPHAAVEPGQVPPYHRRAGAGFEPVRQRVSEQVSPRNKSVCLPPPRSLLAAYAAVSGERTGTDPAPLREELLGRYREVFEDCERHAPAGRRPAIRQRATEDDLEDTKSELAERTRTIERLRTELADAVEEGALLRAEINRLDRECARLRRIIDRLKEELSIDDEVRKLAKELAADRALARVGGRRDELRLRIGSGASVPEDSLAWSRLAATTGAVTSTARRASVLLPLVLALAVLLSFVLLVAPDTRFSYAAGTQPEPQTRLVSVWTPVGSDHISKDAGWRWSLAAPVRTEFTAHVPGDGVAGELVLEADGCFGTTVTWDLTLGGQRTSGSLTTTEPRSPLALSQEGDFAGFTIEFQRESGICPAHVRWEYPADW